MVSRKDPSVNSGRHDKSSKPVAFLDFVVAIEMLGGKIISSSHVDFASNGFTLEMFVG
jgi:hypothetical protein